MTKKEKLCDECELRIDEVISLSEHNDILAKLMISMLENVAEESEKLILDSIPKETIRKVLDDSTKYYSSFKLQSDSDNYQMLMCVEVVEKIRIKLLGEK